MKRELVFGVGINDADYKTSNPINGKRIICPYYVKWTSMLSRCYSELFQKNRPSYIGCSVCDEWLTFSNFKSWMEQQDWEGNQLDKDLLEPGNRIYSPESCIFISVTVNSFMNEQPNQRGKFPLGVCEYKNASGGVRLKARCCNPITGKYDHIGTFKCPNIAHQAWRKRKHEIACQLADLQSDKRVADALRARYAP